MEGASLIFKLQDFGQERIAFCSPMSSRLIEAARVLGLDPAWLSRALTVSSNHAKGQCMQPTHINAYKLTQTNKHTNIAGRYGTDTFVSYVARMTIPTILRICSSQLKAIKKNM